MVSHRNGAVVCFKWTRLRRLRCLDEEASEIRRAQYQAAVESLLPITTEPHWRGHHLTSRWRSRCRLAQQNQNPRGAGLAEKGTRKIQQGTRRTRTRGG